MTDDDHPKTEQIHKKRVSGMGRRRFLQTLSAAGFGAGALYLTPNDVQAAASDEVPITYAIVRNESDTGYEPKKKMVPADWYNDLQHAHNVHQQANFLKRPGVAGTTVIPGKYGGENAKIRLEVSKQKASHDSVSLPVAKAALPDAINGVPIEVVEVGSPQLSCYESNYGSSPPAGVQINHGSTYGSLGSPMVKNGNKYFTTNYHIFGGSPTDEKLYQDSSTAIGKVSAYDCSQDFVACTPLNGHTPTRDIVDSSYYTWGHYTASGVDDLAAQGAAAEKHGQRTCKTSGTIHGRGDAWVYDANCISRHDQVKWGTAVEDFYNGDSGSVAYHQYSGDKVLVLDLNAAYVPKDDPTGDYCFGTGAYKIYNSYGFGW